MMKKYMFLNEYSDSMYVVGFSRGIRTSEKAFQPSEAHTYEKSIGMAVSLDSKNPNSVHEGTRLS